MCGLSRRHEIEAEGEASERARACAGEGERERKREREREGVIEERREIRMNPSCDLVVCVCVYVCVLRSGESRPFAHALFLHLLSFSSPPPLIVLSFSSPPPLHLLSSSSPPSPPPPPPQVGNKWMEISRSLRGRSENAVKNRWNSVVRRREERREEQHALCAVRCAVCGVLCAVCGREERGETRAVQCAV